jgi:hypothetical protein
MRCDYGKFSIESHRHNLEAILHASKKLGSRLWQAREPTNALLLDIPDVAAAFDLARSPFHGVGAPKRQQIFIAAGLQIRNPVASTAAAIQHTQIGGTSGAMSLPESQYRVIVPRAQVLERRRGVVATRKERVVILNALDGHEEEPGTNAAAQAVPECVAGMQSRETQEDAVNCTTCNDPRHVVSAGTAASQAESRGYVGATSTEKAKGQSSRSLVPLTHRTTRSTPVPAHT